jgi:uncharacterized protein YutD
MAATGERIKRVYAYLYTYCGSGCLEDVENGMDQVDEEL